MYLEILIITGVITPEKKLYLKFISLCYMKKTIKHQAVKKKLLRFKIILQHTYIVTRTAS